MRATLRSGVLLAGGTSSRFGSPKGLASFAGQRLCDRPLSALLAVCDEVFVAANDPHAAGWFPGLRVVRDVHDFGGGLSALATACTAASQATVLVCAWDMPFVTAALLEQLATEVDAGRKSCVPMHADSSLEPLCAAYDKRSSMRAIEDILVLGDDRSAHTLHDVLGSDGWRIDTHLAAADAARIFSNVNTVDDLERAARWLTTGLAT